MLPTTYVLPAERPRRLLISLFTQAEDGWPFLTSIMDKAFATERVPPHERGLVSDALQDMIRYRRKVRFALGDDAAAWDVLLGTLVVTGKLDPQAAQEAQPGLNVEALVGLDARIDAETDPVRRLGLRHSMPDWIINLLMDEVGAERAGRVAEALNAAPPQTLRVNTLLATRDLVEASLGGEGIRTERTVHAANGLRVLDRTDVFHTRAYAEGHIEMQDEASQLICELVAPPPGSTVVDACAGAGGKTLGVAAMMGNKGRVVALDVHDKRLEELRKRARRAKLSNVQALVLAEGKRPEVTAERVLVDAPCSGLGALRRNPEARWRLQPEDLERLAGQQRQIAEDALVHVLPRGRLIYATCSFARREGEDVVKALLEQHPELEHVRVKEVLGGVKSAPFTGETGFNFRSWPDLQDMDGFFCAVLRKR